MKLTVVLTLIGAALTVALSVAAAVNPFYGIAGLVAVLFILWCCYRPHTAACALAFLTAAFPKAGIKVGTFPFPVFLFGLLLALLLIGVRAKKVRPSSGEALIALTVLTYEVVRISVLWPSGVGVVAATAAWSGVPLLMLMISTRLVAPSTRFRRALEWGFVIAAAYAVLQQLAGIEKTDIPGLTIAYGDSYADKHNVIFSATGEDFSKIPSTYQNGNIFGVVAAVFLTMALLRISKRTATRFDFFLASAAAVSIFLSGSRTAIIGGVIGALIVFATRGNPIRKITGIALLAAGAWVVLRLSPGLAERYTLNNIISSGGSGRTQIWNFGIATMSNVDFVWGTSMYRSDEGWLGIIQQMGLVGAALIFIAAIVFTRRRRELRPLLLVLAACALLDSSYQLFPTWFIVAALGASDLFGRHERKKAPANLPAWSGEKAGAVKV